MDGRNSIGRKVSLLNDESHSSFCVLPRLPPLSVFSRSPSVASSTPSLSPQTPRLVRSESSDSRSALPPSPLTPPFSSLSSSFDHLHHNLGPLYLGRSLAFAKMDDSSASIYPPIPDVSGVAPYPMPVPPSASASNSASSSTVAPVQAAAPSAPQVFRSSQSPISESARLPASSSAKATTKKNQYPCPLAKHFGCNDHFTTSGHAARHAKKHTGKKDAFCPECNKAFTRKDNMEQHRRTHQNVRGPSKSTTDSRVRKSTKQPSSRKSISGPLEAAAVAQLDEQQSRHQQPSHSIMSSTPYYISSEPVQPLPQPMGADFGPRPTLYRSSFPSSLDFMPAQAQMISDPDLHYSYPSPGLSNGLDTLALAASDHRRTSEESS